MGYHTVFFLKSLRLNSLAIFFLDTEKETKSYPYNAGRKAMGQLLDTGYILLDANQADGHCDSVSTGTGKWKKCPKCFVM